MTALNKQAHQTENERMAQSLAERNGEPVEGLRQRISELEEIATDYGMKFQKAQDALKHQYILHKSQMEAAEKRIAELRDWNAGLAQESFTYQQKVAELESRTVVVKQFDEFQIVHYGGSEDYAKGYIDCQNNYNKALASAGIGAKGE